MESQALVWGLPLVIFVCFAVIGHALTKGLGRDVEFLGGEEPSSWGEVLKRLVRPDR